MDRRRHRAAQIRPRRCRGQTTCPPSRWPGHAVLPEAIGQPSRGRTPSSPDLPATPARPDADLSERRLALTINGSFDGGKSLCLIPGVLAKRVVAVRHGHHVIPKPTTIVANFPAATSATSCTALTMNAGLAHRPRSEERRSTPGPPHLRSREPPARRTRVARGRQSRSVDERDHRTCSSPPAGRRVIEGAHLLGDETGAGSSTRRGRSCDSTTNAGRREARQRGCCSRSGCGSPPRPRRQCRDGRAAAPGGPPRRAVARPGGSGSCGRRSAAYRVARAILPHSKARGRRWLSHFVWRDMCDGCGDEEIDMVSLVGDNSSSSKPSAASVRADPSSMRAKIGAVSAFRRSSRRTRGEWCSR